MDEVLQALSDGSRRRVLETLLSGPATAGDLAAQLPIARPGVSRHLRVLREAGLVEVRQDGQRRVYSLRADPMAEVDEWLGRYRAMWQQRLSALHTEVARGNRQSKEPEMTEVARTDTRTIGSLQWAGEKGTVRLEDRYDTDIADLWSAITDPTRLARWIGEVDGDLRLGGEFHARYTSNVQADGRVEACEPPRRLLLRTNPGQPEETVIEAQLTAEGEQTVLVIEERGLAFADLAEHGAGWQSHMEDLAAHLAGRERGGWHDRWAELTPAYREMAQALS